MCKKKYIALLGMFFSSIAFSAPSPFEGFYGNVTLGGMHSQVKNHSSFNFPLILVFRGQSVLLQRLLTAPSLTAYDTSVTGGLGVGYTRTARGWFLYGVEGRVNSEDNITQFNYQFNNHALDNNTTAFFKTEEKLKNDFNLLLKLGVILHPNLLLYALLGPTRGNFHISSQAGIIESFLDLTPTPPIEAFNARSSVKSHTKHYETGFLTGVGMEYLITSTLSLALEYTHTNYGNINSHNKESAAVQESINPLILQAIDVLPGKGTFQFNHKLNTRYDNVGMRLTYYIG